MQHQRLVQIPSPLPSCWHTSGRLATGALVKMTCLSWKLQVERLRDLRRRRVVPLPERRVRCVLARVRAHRRRARGVTLAPEVWSKPAGGLAVAQGC